MLEDVREAGSPPLTFWYESAIRVAPLAIGGSVRHGLLRNLYRKSVAGADAMWNTPMFESWPLSSLGILIRQGLPIVTTGTTRANFRHFHPRVP